MTVMQVQHNEKTDIVRIQPCDLQQGVCDALSVCLTTEGSNKERAEL